MLCDRIAVALDLEHPVWRALVYCQGLCFVCNNGCELSARGAGSDESHALVVVVNGVVPLGSVEDRSLVVFETWNVWEGVWCAEKTAGTDDSSI